MEWAVPLFLLSPWRRESLRAVCGLALVGMNGAMWLLMDIGSFPSTMIAVATALCILVNIEGSRLRGLDAAHRSPYPGATWVLKLKYLLRVERVWTMYAPEPAHYGVCRMDGRSI